MTGQILIIGAAAVAVVLGVVALGDWYLNTQWPIKPVGSLPDAQDVIDLETRRAVFAEDWSERCRIEKTVLRNHPVDWDAAQWAIERQLDRQDSEWKRLYQSFAARLYHDRQIPYWQLLQIVEEGIRDDWQLQLPLCEASGIGWRGLVLPSRIQVHDTLRTLSTGLRPVS